MSRQWWIGIAAGLIAIGSQRAEAQVLDEVRLVEWTSANREEVVVARVDPTLRVPLDSVRRVRPVADDRDERTRLQGVRHGAKVGALRGLAFTLVVSTLAWRSDQTCGDCMMLALPFAIVGGAVVTVGTTLVGATVGGARPGKRSEPSGSEQ